MTQDLTDEKPMTAGTLLLVGYGGAAPATFFAAVNAAMPDETIDIRLKAWGWHELYRGAAMLDALHTATGAPARHEPRLGNPGRFDEGGMRLADERALAPLAAALAAGSRLLLVCGCGRGESCHRTLAAQQLAALVPGLEIIEIGPLSAAKA